MDTRICGLCGIEKPLEQYQRNKSNPLGRAYWCKVCRREFDRQRNRRPDRKLYIKEWETSEHGRQLRAISRKSDREANKEKYRARRILTKLIKDGLIKRMPCIECGEVNSDGHHPDYSNAVGVIWLCPKHHAKIHRLTIEKSQQVTTYSIWATNSGG